MFASLSVHLFAVALIGQLGSDVFTEREDASRQLAALSSLVVGELEIAAEHDDPEIARRAKTLLDRYYNVQPTAWPLLPWIDSLPADWPERTRIIRTYLEKASNTYWSNEHGWPYYRVATALYTRDLLRQGMPRAAVIAVLDRMVPGDKAQCEKYRYPVPQEKAPDTVTLKP